MDFVELILAILGILVALSGWTGFLYEIYTRDPKIKGKIITVLETSPNNPLKPDSRFKQLFVYLYMINQRRNTIHLVNYQLEIDRGNGWERVDRITGYDQIGINSFESVNGLTIPNFSDKILHSRIKPISNDAPIHGFLPFLLKDDDPNLPILKYRLTCGDLFGIKKFTFCKDRTESLDRELFQDLAGMIYGS